ncbi:MAG TPA: molybdopterin-dependent oxidoreductase, partial [Telluria sp.]|nr:molybdopterin-dependent oxidoreductase [Telluria sp.]
DSIAAVANGTATLEELHLLAKVTRGLGSANIDYRLRQSDFSLDEQVVPWLGMPVAELSTVKRVLVIGSFLRKDHPLVATRLRAAAKAGAKLAIINGSREDNLIPTATNLTVAPSDWLAALSEIVAGVAEAKGLPVPAGFEQVQVGVDALAIAKGLLDVGAELPGAILMGNGAAQHPQASKLHAAAQWIAEQTGAKFGYLLDSANAVGGYIAGAVAKPESAFASPKKAFVVLHAEPELDAANPQQARAALDAAEMVVVMSPFKHGFEYADVLLPVSPFSETSGTFVNCEGRAQSFNGTVRPLGETRPAWKVLRVLGNLLQMPGFDFETSEQVRDDVLGKGVTDLSAKLNNIAKLAPQAAAYGTAGELERVTNVPVYFTDAVVRRSEPLQRTADANAPLASLPLALAEKLGVKAGDKVKVTQGSGSAVLVADIDARLPANAVRVAAGHPATATLGAMFGAITVEKAGEGI